MAVTKQRLLALLNHRRRQALRGRRPRRRSVVSSESTTTTTTTTSPHEFEAIRVLLDSNIEDTARVTFSETAREENLRQRMRLLEDILLISEDIEVAEKRLLELEKENKEEDRTEATVLSRQKSEMETRLQSLQERLRLCDAVVDETERVLKDREEKQNVSSTDVIESLSKDTLQNLVQDLVQRASDFRAAELLANQSQEMSETRRELAIRARDTAWKELSSERKSQRAEIRRIHSTYQEEIVSGETMPSWVTERFKKNEAEIERLKRELNDRPAVSTEPCVDLKGAALPNIAQDIGVTSSEISDSLREEITRRQRDHEKVWTERRDILSKCVVEGSKLLTSLRGPLGSCDEIEEEKTEQSLLTKWNRLRETLLSSLNTVQSRSRRLVTCTSEIVRMRKEFEETCDQNVVPECVSKLATVSLVETVPDKASFETLLTENIENRLSFVKCFGEIASICDSVEAGLLCTWCSSLFYYINSHLNISQVQRTRALGRAR